MQVKLSLKTILLIFLLLSGAVAFIWIPNKYYRYIRRHVYIYITTPRTVIPEVTFQKINLGEETKGLFTSLTMGPNNKLYACTIEGKINAFDIKSNGNLVLEHTYFPFGETEKLTIGLHFDPGSTTDSLIVWMSYSDYNPGWYNSSNSPLNETKNKEWAGRLARLYIDDKSNTVLKNELIVTNLPRFGPNKENLVNSIDFGPDEKLYFAQGASTGMGWCDCEEGQEPSREALLSGAVLGLDISLLPKKLPLDAKTIDGGGSYDPYQSNAPLKLYATGLRNAYDLVWHSNGQLYATINGAGSKENTPSSDPKSPYYIEPNSNIHYSGPKIPAVIDVQPDQNDYLARVEPGGYYGHPNPLRGEYVLNRGDRDVDNFDYNGIKPDANFRGFTYDFGPHIAPTGIIEYTSNTFNGVLKGCLMVCRLVTKDIVITRPNGEKKDINQDYDGGAMGLQLDNLPIDLVENPNNGDIYVSTLNGKSITLFHPYENGQDRISVKVEQKNLEGVKITNSGHEIYNQNCQICHGAEGQGSSGPSLVSVKSKLSSSQIHQVITNGSINGGMPAWKGKLSEVEIERVLTYVKSF